LQFTTDAGQKFQITVSLGEDRSHSDDQNYLDVYNRADQYLYNSKRSGRNTITINGQTLPQR
jgi:PleD family two-component response regulator